MAAEAIRALVHRFFDILNRGDLAALDEVLAEDYVAHFAGAPGPMDRETFRQFTATFLAAFPDLVYAVEDIVAEETKAAPRLTLSGTHLGEFQGLLPTGRRVIFTAMNTMRIEEGKIVEHWSEFDSLGMMQQLGAIPEASAASDGPAESRDD